MVYVGGGMPTAVSNTSPAPLHVLITGGTGTLGEAIVAAFANAGHRIHFQYHRNREAAERLRRDFGATGIAIDFSREFEIPSGDFDVLINCAGINESVELTDGVRPIAWEKMLRINVTVPFMLTQAVLPGMVKRGWGRLINIGSIYSLRGGTHRAPYVASKHALSGLTKVVAKEYAGSGVTCNEICPSAVDSRMINRIAEDRAVLRGTTTAAILDEYRSMSPSGRMGTADEVASVALYLAGPGAGFVNGASIPVDGGLVV
jgi:3-hydroxybutyrate dehydrogenase